MSENLTEVSGRDLLGFNTCSLLEIHNVFLKGLEKITVDVSSLVVSVFNYFDGWPGWSQEYTTIWKKISVPNHHLIKHVASRGLKMGPAAVNLLE